MSEPVSVTAPARTHEGGEPGVPASHDLQPPGDLVALLLAEQRSLTAVEVFSRDHAADGHAQARYYSKLLPATPPGPGQQYAFDVDLDRCSGCKACVTACHSLNGLDDTETWRDVGLLVGGDTANPLLQHVTTACHHCLDPGCLEGCPVDAYEKDPITGIVRHLDDQCFGCQYCTLTCPYEVPQYHAAKGIVRKCDMCSQRLTAGEAPACVQACPHEAIAIQVVNVDDVTTEGTVVPTAPASNITRPTTTYRTRRDRIAETRSVDHDNPRPQHAHVPLVAMLVLTQLAAGAFLVGSLLALLPGEEVTASVTRWLTTFATAALHAGLVASTLHLGRPLYAFRGVLGWRHSWLSREIIAFGAFAGLATPAAVLAWWPLVGDSVRAGLGWAVVVSAAVGVFCSVMIYAVTRRELWTLTRTGIRFGLTSVVLGLAAALTVSATFADSTATPLAVSLAAALTAKLIFDLAVLKRLRSTDPDDTLRRTAQLMLGPLRFVTLARVVGGVVGGLGIPLAMAAGYETDCGILAGIACGCCLVGELAERYLFFAAAAPPRMPGGVPS